MTKWKWEIPSLEQYEFIIKILKDHDGHVFWARTELLRQMAMGKTRKGEIQRKYCVHCGKYTDDHLRLGTKEKGFFWVSVCQGCKMDWWRNWEKFFRITVTKKK
jgi:hypothetical protein